jgi:hypothetical protein
MSDPFSSLPDHGRERARFGAATQYLVGSRLRGDTTSDEEMIKKAGYLCEAEYWRVATSRPMKALAFASFLAGFHLNPAARDDQMLRFAIEAALCLALRTGQPWFIEDHRSPARGPGDLTRLSLEPRGAAEWFLSLPTERGLIPPGLRAFLEPGERRQAERVAGTRGGRPAKYDRKMIEEEVSRLMGEHGDFMVADPEWNAHARLEEELMIFCKAKFRSEPVRSTLAPAISAGLEKWRSKRA